MKKNHSAEWKRLWVESSINRVPLLFTVFVRFMIALAFIFYIINFLSRFTNALIVCIGAAVVMLMITSRRIKKRSIVMERVFVHNLRSRDIARRLAKTGRSTRADCWTGISTSANLKCLKIAVGRANRCESCICASVSV